MEADQIGQVWGCDGEMQPRQGGGAVKVLCVQKDGHYYHGAKITIIFAIEPGDAGLAPHV